MGNRVDSAEYREIAEMFGLESSEVGRAVESYFSLVLSDARKLPFDNPQKIYSKAKFGSFSRVRGIPYIGRMGPSYTRYLKWRANEAKDVDMVNKPKRRPGYSKEEIETFAEALLSGKAPKLPEMKSVGELYKRVWLVGDDGRKQASQVILKENNKK